MMRCAGIVLSLFMIAVLLVVGCETESSEGDVSSTDMALTPSAVTLDATVSTNLVFSVDGGAAPYEWDLSDTSLGTLVDTGEMAIYTSGTSTGETVITVTDSENVRASAIITQE